MAAVNYLKIQIGDTNEIKIDCSRTFSLFSFGLLKYADGSDL